MRREYLLGIGAFLALLCLMVVLYSLSRQQGGLPPQAPSGNYIQNGTAGTYGIVSLQITDPSRLPKGTSSLMVTFSNISVYSQGVGWVGGGGFGPVNLPSQIGRGLTVSSIGVTHNSVITAARLGIGSASMTVNGVRYNVTFPGGAVVANLTGIKIDSDKTLLIDILPFTLSPVRSGNVAVGYSVRGYVSSGSSGYEGQEGRVSLNAANEAAPYANLTVQNATISAQSGVTSVQVTVVNHSNMTAKVGSVVLVGAEEFAYNTATIQGLANSYADAIIQRYQASVKSSASGGAGGSLVAALFNTSASGASAGISASLYSQALGFGSNLTNIVYSNVSALAQLAGPLPVSLLGAGANITALRGAVYQNIYGGLYNASVSQAGFQSSRLAELRYGAGRLA